MSEDGLTLSVTPDKSVLRIESGDGNVSRTTIINSDELSLKVERGVRRDWIALEGWDTTDGSEDCFCRFKFEDPTELRELGELLIDRADDLATDRVLLGSNND